MIYLELSLTKLQNQGQTSNLKGSIRDLLQLALKSKTRTRFTKIYSNFSTIKFCERIRPIIIFILTQDLLDLR